MSISKGWVDLNGPTVALHGTIDVLHLFQSVAHVTVRISKVGVDSVGGDQHYLQYLPLLQGGDFRNIPDSFLVVDQCLSQLALHL